MATEREFTTPIDKPDDGDQQRIAKTDDPGKGPEGIVPDLQSRIVIGVFDRYQRAADAAKALQNGGYSSEDVSVVMQPEGTAPELGSGETKADQGTIMGASTGAILGGALGLVALSIPGIGPLLAAGPLAAAISGALVGGSLGGLVGSITGLGVPTEHAEAYERAIRNGGIVVAVRTPDRERADQVSRVLNDHGAREVGGYTQAL